MKNIFSQIRKLLGKNSPPDQTEVMDDSGFKSAQQKYADAEKRITALENEITEDLANGKVVDNKKVEELEQIKKVLENGVSTTLSSEKVRKIDDSEFNRITEDLLKGKK